jgi:hypothetical protein
VSNSRLFRAKHISWPVFVLFVFLNARGKVSATRITAMRAEKHIRLIRLGFLCGFWGKSQKN